MSCQTKYKNTEKVEELIERIQHFDPPGVCARNLQECLLLQLQRKRTDGKSVELAIEVLSYYFEEFTKKHYDKIQRGLNLSDDEFRDIIKQIVKLNPKPGGNLSETTKMESYVVPDFFIFNNKFVNITGRHNQVQEEISQGYHRL